ncbi:hypothetical protein NC797_16530 [Aquibacillus sp. 3ASR75-11]|uniref:Uncharacterized protein n=1 Tax=Terrihalobacillus insolitus TaxID=2950438 RepID=A0A9X3WZ99_9BACI|nr:hypothetical protein [Terrihalobacillus insolitus]MDC3414894.1 hypothetical protein [Terrihalobacillus insolitus]MDC3426104.1 hypothetical protein [Terrihalobacillus insolitus]
MRFCKRITMLSAFLFFSITFVSWAYGEALRLNINVKPDSTLSSGKAAAVTSLSGGAYSLYTGRAYKISGIPLYKIDLGNKRYSELAQIIVTVFGINEDNNLLKDNWWVEVGVYYELPASATNADYVLELEDGTDLKVNMLSDDVLFMNRTQASGILAPQQLIPQDARSNTTLYIIATYKNPGGKVAPGQQEQINNLTFDLMVRM